LILSLYDKGAPAVQKWIKDGLLRYAHQKKARTYFLSARLQLPREGSKVSNKNLLTEAEVVNDAVNPDAVLKIVDQNGEPTAAQVTAWDRPPHTPSPLYVQAQLDSDSTPPPQKQFPSK
jgi:hypothetical protein